MKRISPLIVVVLFVSSNALCSGLYVKKNSGEVVYTNINTHSFFKRAFSIARQNHYSKSKIVKLIKSTAIRLGVDPKLAVSIAKIESDFNHNSVSSSGAKGVMQLMDKTAKFYGVRDINSIKENIAGGVRFLKHLTKKYKSLQLVAAAYNAGETAVDKYKGIPPFAETQRYVRKFIKVYYGREMKFAKTGSVHVVRQPKPIRKKGNVYSNVGGSIW